MSPFSLQMGEVLHGYSRVGLLSLCNLIGVIQAKGIKVEVW